MRAELVALMMAVLLTGCAGDAAARRLALKLQAQAGVYQSQIDDKIAQQRAFYDARVAAIAEDRRNGRPLALAQLREERAIRTASNMASDPNGQVRMSALVDHLIAANDAEYALQVELYKKELDTKHEVEAMIQALVRKRDSLDKVKASLAALTSGKTDSARAKDVLALAEDTIAKVQAAK